MRIVLTVFALILGTARLSAQEPPVPYTAPAPPADQQPAPVQSVAGPDSLVPTIVAVVCTVAILFAVCYRFRRDE